VLRLLLTILLKQVELKQSSVQGLENSIAATQQKIAKLNYWVQQQLAEKSQAVSSPAPAATSMPANDNTQTDPLSSSSVTACETDTDTEVSSTPMPLRLLSKEKSDTSCNTERDTLQSSIGQPSTLASNEDNFPVSTFLPLDLLHLVLTSTVYDSAMNDICNGITPYSSNLHHNRVLFLSDQLKGLHHASVFDVGLHAIDFALSEDEVRLLFLVDNAFVNPAAGASMSASMEAAEKSVAALIRGLAQNTPSTTNINNSNINSNGNPLSAEAISISFHLQHQRPGQVTGILDNQVPFSIVFRDNSNDVALLMFFEAFNNLVGKDNVFKRSVNLIRSWWIHESVLYVGATIRHYLPNNTLIVMIVSIFNKHWKHIATPLHALCLFLAEYSLLQPSIHVITVCGLQHEPDVDNNIFAAPAPPMRTLTLSQSAAFSDLSITTDGEDHGKHDSSFLMDEKFIEAFKINLLHVAELNLPQQPHEDSTAPPRRGLSRDNSREMPIDLNGGVPERGKFSRENSSSNTVGNLRDNLSRENSRSEKERGLVILHPLTGENMVTDKLTANQLIRLTKAMQNGTSNLAVFLRQMQERERIDGNQSDLIKNFFPNLVSDASLKKSDTASL
jgi:hypothetical protein